MKDKKWGEGGRGGLSKGVGGASPIISVLGVKSIYMCVYRCAINIFLSICVILLCEEEDAEHHQHNNNTYEPGEEKEEESERAVSFHLLVGRSISLKTEINTHTRVISPVVHARSRARS